MIAWLHLSLRLPSLLFRHPSRSRVDSVLAGVGGEKDDKREKDRDRGTVEGWPETGFQKKLSSKEIEH